ncbi:MAG: homoserine kinase, partial [Negativicutes bacterium]|nr:homoserine kinase [Negativicutes bacterium]
MRRKVKVSVPATTANCGPGYDCLGIACTLYNRVEVELVDEPGVTVSVTGEGQGALATDETNLVCRAVREAWRVTGFDHPGGIRMAMNNGIPLSRGLGSSAAAVVAGLLA